MWNATALPGRKIGIEVTQRLPLLRVMAANGDNYYIDSKGKVMPIPNSSAHVAVVTGSVDRDFATKELYKLGIFLQIILYGRPKLNR